MADISEAPRMPMSLEAVTPTWLTQELALNYPGVKVTEVAVRHVNPGTATKVILGLSYNAAGEAAGLPPAMCLKIGFDPLHFEIGRAIYENEARFYRDIAPTIPGLQLPHCYAARTDQETGQTAIFLEDLTLRGATFGDIRNPALSLEIVRGLIDWLAILHARYWDDPMLATLQRASTETIEGWMGYVLQSELWDEAWSSPRGAQVDVSEKLRDRDNIYNSYVAMQKANATRTQCFIHADLHAGNMYFEPDGTAAFLDWQGSKCGHWAFDFSYFLASNLTIEDRRKHEKELLRLYLDRLAVHLAAYRPGYAAPDWDEAWLSYRQNLSHGTGWIACPASSQPEEICLENARRIMTAADDNDLLDANGIA